MVAYEYIVIIGKVIHCLCEYERVFAPKNTFGESEGIHKKTVAGTWKKMRALKLRI